MNTVISVKVDKEVKDSAQEVAKSAGISLSALINTYLRQVIATRRIEIYAPESMTPKLETAVLQAEKDIQNNQVEGPFSTADEVLAALRKKPRK